LLHNLLAFGVSEVTVDGRHVAKEFADGAIAAQEFFMAENAPKLGLDLSHEATCFDVTFMLTHGFGNNGSSGSRDDDGVGGRCGRRNKSNASVEGLITGRGHD
jgi:hypothetical protein